MTIPEPFDDQNITFFYNRKVNGQNNFDSRDVDRILSIDPDKTTFIRSNLAITNVSGITIPNVYEAIVSLYDVIKEYKYDIDHMKTDITNLKNK